MDDPNTATAEEITFYSYWLPTLAPGAYSVTVTPTLTANVAKEKRPPEKEPSDRDSNLPSHRDFPCRRAALRADRLGSVLLLSGAGPDRPVLRHAAAHCLRPLHAALGAHD